MGEIMRALDHNTALDEADRLHLRHLVREWHLISDLAFSDLILWAPDPDPNVLWAIAQIRPITGPTALLGDVVGERIAYDPDELAVQALASGEVAATSDNKLESGIPVDVVAYPVRTPQGKLVGVLEKHANRMGVRAPGLLEDTYLEIADLLTGMVGRGEFPIDGPPTRLETSPRVGDGLIWVGPSREIVYASPNAISTYRRLGLAGDLIEQPIDHLMAQLTPSLPEDMVHLREVIEFDMDHAPLILRVRALPLRDLTGNCGYLILLRDVTEIRLRERELVTKDATIREIHHRVKNNLQTVAALLRMQSRRMESVEARTALGDAMSRVAAIAAVHEILSQAFDDEMDFDDVADKVLEMVSNVAGPDIRVARRGRFGRVNANIATSLALVVTELCQNSIEHGLEGEAGTVDVIPERHNGWLEVRVVDEGKGLPPDFDPERLTSLGLSIVRTLVSDLGGTFALLPGDNETGCVALVRLPLVRQQNFVGFN